MNETSLPYSDILTDLRARLTGDPPHDLALLKEHAERYREEPWAEPFLRELGRLFYDLMPEELRNEAAEAARGDMQRYEDLRRSAWEHLQGNRLDEALRDATELWEAVRHFGKSDLDATYFDYEDALEEEFHRAQPGTPATARPAPLSHQPALVLLSQVRLARREEAEALRLLDLAIGRAPAAVLPRFLRLNLLKKRGEVELAFREGREALTLCHLPADLAQAWRHLGWCLADMERWEPAAAALLASLHHDWNRLALDELDHVLRASGGLDLEDVSRRASGLLEGQGVPPAPDPRWREAAKALRERSDAESAAWCAQVLAALEAPLDLEALALRVQGERAAPPAARYLRSLQRELLGRVSPASIEAGRAALARELEEAPAQPFWADEITDDHWDQSPLFGQPILAEMGTRLLEAAEKLGLPAGPAGAWGVLPLPGLLARVLVAPTGERVPVVSSGWLLFAYLMGKVTASCLPVRLHEGREVQSFQRELVEAHLESDPEPQRRFAELMQATAGGDPGRAPTWILGGAASQLGALFCDSLELFLMAEQLALAKAVPVREEALGALTVQRVAPDQDGQVQAAVVALQLAGAVKRQQGLGFALCAAAIASGLYGAALAERLAGPPSVESNGFLTPGYRCQIILHVLKEHAPEALDLAETLTGALGLLWQRAALPGRS